MLLLTMKAKEAIRTLTENHQVPLGSGLRISLAQDDEDVLELTLDVNPRPGDEVLNNGGIWIFLDPRVSEPLSEQVLDIRDGQVPTDFYFIAQRS